MACVGGYMGCGGINFLHLNFSCFYCSIDPKRQSERLGLRPDTSSLVKI